MDRCLRDKEFAKKKFAEVLRNETKELKQKGIIIENPNFYQKSKGDFKEVGIEFDEDGNITNELNDETIEKIYGVFNKIYKLDSILDDDDIATMKEVVIKEYKGNPHYLSTYIEELRSLKELMDL